jgi:hypothetical protein
MPLKQTCLIISNVVHNQDVVALIGKNHVRQKCTYCNSMGYIITTTNSVFGVPHAGLCPACGNNQLEDRKKLSVEDTSVFDYII